MGALALVTALMLSAPPGAEVGVVQRDEWGCGKAALGTTLLTGGPRQGCLREAFAARLEGDDTLNVVLLVELPHRFDPRVRPRLFVYRLVGGALVPRFLGSGPRSLSLVSARALPAAAGDELELRVEDPLHEVSALRCRFEEFPLVCH